MEITLLKNYTWRNGKADILSACPFLPPVKSSNAGVPVPPLPSPSSCAFPERSFPGLPACQNQQRHKGSLTLTPKKRQGNDSAVGKTCLIVQRSAYIIQCNENLALVLLSPSHNIRRGNSDSRGLFKPTGWGTEGSGSCKLKPNTFGLKISWNLLVMKKPSSLGLPWFRNELDSTAAGTVVQFDCKHNFHLN